MRDTLAIIAALALAACNGTGGEAATGASAGTSAGTPAIGTLWVGGGGAINSSSLETSGSFGALDVTCNTPGAKPPLEAASALDGLGDLWVSFASGGSNAAMAGTLIEWKASSLADCATAKPAVRAAIPFPLLAMAFDAAGNLWGTFYYSNDDTNPQGIAVFQSGALSAKATLKPTSTLSSAACAAVDDLCNPSGLAFDSDGFLWVTSSASILAYSPATLAGLMSSGTATPDHVLTTQEAKEVDGQGGRFFSSYLFLAPAFDADGNLWVGVDNFEANPIEHSIVEFSRDQLGNIDSDDTPNPIRTIEETAQQQSSHLIDWGALAFDARGNLWAGASETAPNLWRYPAASLATSNPTPDIGITLPGDPSISLAFAPIPGGLPLH